MRRHIVLITALFYLLGSVGIPVAVYSCIESGESGMVAGLSTSPRSCYADACCDDERDPSGVRIESGIPCCDLSVQVEQENNHVLLPSQKNIYASLLANTTACLAASWTDVRILPAPPRIVTFHASIKLPLLI